MVLQRKLCVSLFALSTAMLVGQATATVILPQNLEQLESQAQLVFVGICTTRTATTDERGVPVNVFTFEVIEPVKGNLKKGNRIEVRQFGNDAPNAKGFAVRIPGVPNYPIGRKVLLFLNPPSKIGLTAPVGLSQGVFLVEQNVEGKEVIRLDPLRRKLLVGKMNVAGYVQTGRFTAAEVAMLSNPPESVELPAFCSLVRKLAQERERMTKPK